ncbi:uncharacterized protein LOC110275626 [Arachis duranensis]|uniref:Uncharacterized protein LOC110275626 n=1 Tax=Arachis duranensis TaxID=130453 RepID=A0A9C6T580_ARADU|nr:uncharacterized protein LOC110275626 [Arachis duranensis]
MAVGYSAALAAVRSYRRPASCYSGHRLSSPLLLGADCRVAAEPIRRPPLFRFSRSSFGSPLSSLSPSQVQHTQFPLLSLKERSKENEKGNKGKGDPEEERAPGKQQLAGQPRSAATSSSPLIALPFATTTAPIAPSLGRTESRRGWLVNVGGRGLGAATSPSPPRPRRAAATARVCRRHLITAGRHRRREKLEFCTAGREGERDRGSHLRLSHRRRTSLPSPNLLAVATEAAFVDAVGGMNGRRTRRRELTERVMRDGGRLFRRPCCRQKLPPSSQLLQWSSPVVNGCRNHTGASGRFCHLRPRCRRRKILPIAAAAWG